MKKINLVSGFGAKFAVAAFAVAGLTLTSCEKESFDVNVPNINIKVPEVEFPEKADGVAYVILSAASTNGATLSDVTFEVVDSENAQEQTKTLYKFTTGGSLTVKASKDGYETVIKTQVVPAPEKDSYTTYNMDFVLNALTETVAVEPGDIIEGEVGDPSIEVPAPEPLTNLEAGEQTITIPVATGVAYSAQQIADLLAEVEALTGPTSRAIDEAKVNLETAQGALREKIATLPTSYGVAYQQFQIVLSDAASKVEVELDTEVGVCEVTISVTVAGEEYAVKGKANKVTSVKVAKVTADGVDVTHDHDHGHGEGDAGGGTSGK